MNNILNPCFSHCPMWAPEYSKGARSENHKKGWEGCHNVSLDVKKMGRGTEMKKGQKRPTVGERLRNTGLSFFGAWRKIWKSCSWVDISESMTEHSLKGPQTDTANEYLSL